MKNNIITRFAPSPTGALHIGSARTALFNFVFAKHTGGSMSVRIEDTDKKRSKKKYEKDIIENLTWLGIKYTSLVRQSERLDIYEKYILNLINKDFAYIAEDGVIRFRNPNKTVTFHDLIRGDIKVDTTDLGDFVIARNKKDPVYHLAVVIDDHEMGVTHLIRGEDHISNTPRQILIQEAIGATRPHYAHVPLILGSDRSKLSKRHNAVPVSQYREKGYLPEALINFMALLGWSPQHHDKEGPEIFSLDELIKLFSLDGIQKGGAVFNIEKLQWVNREHIKKLSRERLKQEIAPFLPMGARKASLESNRAFTRILMEKIAVFSDIQELYEAGDLSYFWKQPVYKIQELLWKDEADLSVVTTHIDKIIELLSKISNGKFTEEAIKKSVWKYATDKGRGLVLWPFRYALSGKEKSPDPFTIAEVLGKKETLKRLTYAITHIKEQKN